jgi:hypothetical protein
MSPASLYHKSLTDFDLAWLPQKIKLGATQLVELLAGNPGHPTFLAILDTTIDAAAMSVLENAAAEADGRTPPSAQGVHVLE